MAKSHSNESQAFCDWAATYVVHLALLRRLPLGFRSLGEVTLGDEEVMERLLSEFSTVCTDMMPHISSEVLWDSFDILDGRLLRFVGVKQLRLPEDILLEAHGFSKEIHRVAGVNIEPSLLSFSLDQLNAGAPTQLDENRSIASGCGVLPFSQPILDSYLGELQLTPVKAHERQSLPMIFKELSHWHNSRVPLDVKRPPPRKTKWEARSNQIQLNTFMKYSASLTNAAGKMIDPEVIVVIEHPTEQKSSSAAKQSKPSGSDTKLMKSSKATKPDTKSDQSTSKNRKKPKEMSGKEKALKEADNIRKEKVAVKSNTAFSAWEEQCKRLEEVPNLVTRYRETIKYLNGLKSDVKVAIGPDVSVYSCNILASMLLEPGQLNPERNRRISALLWSTIVELSKQDISPSSGKLFNVLADALGHPATAAATRQNPAPLSRPLSYSTFLDKQAKSLNLPKVSIDFQLRHCGPFLERSFDPAPDSRVSFHPDAWQRQVLDAVDAEKSLLVVAPTSAGKTFISFYAM